MDFEAPMGPVTYDNVKAWLVSIMKAAELAADDWIAGEPSHQWLEIDSHALVATAAANDLAPRSNSLDTATDPNDIDSDGVLRPDVGPAWLSSKGEKDYGTARIGEIF